MVKITNSVCHLVADLLAAYGIRHIVTSPGSRDATLIAVLARKGCFELHPVVDERTAAFIGLGMALRSAEPVALVCTSGTALLNYGPAMAEAFISPAKEAKSFPKMANGRGFKASHL